MPKPVLIINPVTGQQSFTKHPEKLIRRHRAEYEAERLVVIAQEERSNPRYWNGSDRNPYAIHRPGEVRS